MMPLDSRLLLIVDSSKIIPPNKGEYVGCATPEYRINQPLFKPIFNGIPRNERESKNVLNP
jgi:hypothetical protein